MSLTAIPSRFHVLLCAFLLSVLVCVTSSLRGDALDRLRPDRLEATHNAIEQFRLDRQPVQLAGDYQDVRTLLHIHSHLSHDSIGTPEDIRQAAKEAGVRVVMFTNHPADDYDYIEDGHRGDEDGVLFIPGAEEKGLLAFPRHSVDRPADSTPQQKTDTVLAADGQVFLSHLEERMDWELTGLTGTEIYNIHADFKDEPRLLRGLINPLTLMTTIMPAVEKYPQETIAALQNYPAEYLRRWDELNPKHRLTGISANDAHQNTGFRAVVADDGTLRLEDMSGDQLALLDPEKLPFLKPLLANKQPGEDAFKLQLDPYVCSFRHVSTHLLLQDVSEDSVREALSSGRAYVAFDWMCDPTGFVFQAVDESGVHEMGSDVKRSPGMQFRAEAPLVGTFKLMRDGTEIRHSRGRTFEYDVTEDGIYRLEVWLNLPDEPQIWILSNPIYVGMPASAATPN